VERRAGRRRRPTAGDGLSVPATGKPVRFRGITWMRFRGGKIAEGWDAWNAGGLMQQLQSGT
jgi:hypothetical protein